MYRSHKLETFYGLSEKYYLGTLFYRDFIYTQESIFFVLKIILLLYSNIYLTFHINIFFYLYSIMCLIFNLNLIIF